MVTSAANRSTALRHYFASPHDHVIDYQPGRLCLMPSIARFNFAHIPRVDAVCIHLQWQDGGRQAHVLLPPELAHAIKSNPVALPSPKEAETVESAIAYGLFVALWSNTDFLITGDESVWPEEWDDLAIVDAAN